MKNCLFDLLFILLSIGGKMNDSELRTTDKKTEDRETSDDDRSHGKKPTTKIHIIPERERAGSWAGL